MSRNECLALYGCRRNEEERRSFLQKSDERPAFPGGTLRGVQALRAVACLMVVAFHVLEAAAKRSGTAWPNGSGGVDLFFVISGFVMFTSSRRLAELQDGWRVFLQRRLERIVPLYWLLTAAKTAIALTAPGLAPTTRLSTWNLAASLLFIPARDAAGIVRPVLPVGWTLNYEMLFYVIFAAALALRRGPLGILLPVLLPLGLAGFWRQEDWPAALSLANGLVLELCGGVALAQAMARGWRPNQPASAFLLAAGAVLLLMVPAAGPWRFVAWGLPALLMVAGTVGLEASFGRRLPALLLELGDASYAIYLSHVFIVPVLVQALAGAGLPASQAATVLLPACLVVCSAAGLALHRFVDAPIQAWLRRRPPRHALA